ncbi:MAG: ribonuclease R [Gammaproteobacteria bacterium]|nr:MAG: ribonuclease R [Gammaproteobacteria bacterium]
MPKKSSRRRRAAPARRTGEQGYRHPVPEPSRLIELLEERGVPMDLDELAEACGLKGARQRAALRRRLQRMAAAGQLLINRRGEYCLLQKLDVVVGRVSAHPDGYGFLIPDDGGEDIYLPYQEMRSLLDGDRVAVRVGAGGRGGRRAGTVVEILERGRTTVVGRYQRHHGVGYVIEAGRSSRRFLVPDHQRNGARHGEIVKLEITEYPDARHEAQGKVLRVLGDTADGGVITDMAIEQYALPASFSAAAMRAAADCGERVRPRDKAGREDLRRLPLVTIDGEDARDFDDAVFAEPSGEGWRLLVAIADVSHYVRPGSPLDRDASQRGTSVYFADRVVPMLPESLSNGLCSLNPGVDRLSMVCEMQVNRRGEVGKARFYRAVIRSAARLTYTEVDRLQRTGKGRAALRRLRPQIQHLYQVYRALAAARRRRGALDLELPEVRIELGADGHVDRIVPRHRNDAHRLIEECMIAANVQAAKFLRRSRLPTLYRVHPGPGEEKFEELRLMLQELGIKVPEQARAEPRYLNRALRQIAERPDAAQLSMAVLRSLSPAVYQPDPAGHFGLALKDYAHFTSPIRRYPDLIVHRGIAHRLAGRRPGEFPYDRPAMELAGRRCSEQERRADEATRYVEARLKAAYLQDHVGDVLPGTITGVTHFGLFVTLDELYVDGLIHVSSLGHDYFHLTHSGLRLTGERSGISYGLGDNLLARVLRVDPDEAKVDLALAEEQARPARRGRRRRAHG